MLTDFLILYGSQTGQSEAIAHDIRNRAKTTDLNPRLFCLDQTEKQFWIERERLVVFVISSTGDGDPPDNATKFVRRLHKRDLPLDYLSELRFALLGLGDSNYSTFLGCPKKLERRLLELGAKPFYPTAFADDAVGLEIVADPWLDSLIPALQEFAQSGSTSSTSTMEAVNKIATLMQGQKVNETPGTDSSSSGQFTCELPLSSEKIRSDEELAKIASGEIEEDDDGVDCSVLAPCQCKWPTDKSSLVKSLDPKLSAEEDLRVPIATESYIAVSLCHEDINVRKLPWQNGCPFPGTVGGLHQVPLVEVKKLTEPGAKKDKLEFSVDIKGTNVTYEPGDSFYFAFPNPPNEVEYILRRLRLAVLADKKCRISVRSDSKSDKATMPSHVPAECSLRHLLTWCLDIRRTPGRPFLRVMAEHATDADEKRRLLELCSSQGQQEFTSFVRQAGVSVADLFHAFPSCLFPVERLVELLPRLQPRPYTVACSPLKSTKSVRFLYSLIVIPKGDGRFHDRQGLCTGWISQCKPGDKIQIVVKEPSGFRLPAKNTVETPLIMVGPGAGLAPFIGFLEHLQALTNSANKSSNDVNRWLYFGCRNMSLDYIYRGELEQFEKEKVLGRLGVCESEQKSAGTRPRYVQDFLKQHGKEVVDLILAQSQPKTRIYVCGDAKGMSKDVFKTFVDLLKQHAGKEEMEAIKFLTEMKQNQLYNEDVWS